VPLRVVQELPSARLRASVEASARFHVEPLAQLHAPALERLRVGVEPSEQPRAWAEPLARHAEFELWARLRAPASAQTRALYS